ncbi:MAG TPA: RraA family protein [Bryobacteraceae bacterium]|nr:RraA family protein [Bryobacteraceae bacterium]
MSKTNGTLSDQDLERLRRIDACTLSNAIERLNLRPRNEGFISGGVTCRFPKLPAVAGYAITARMRSSMTPVAGRCYYENAGWWRYVASCPRPGILVIQDADEAPRIGALLGEAYARISRALHCVGCITDGSVRDLPGIEGLGFQVFDGGVSVSHAYAHVVDFGAPVTIGGLRIASGDLLHGDVHGVQAVPLEAARQLPEIAERVLREDEELFALTERKDFSVELLTARLEPGAQEVQ